MFKIYIFIATCKSCWLFPFLFFSIQRIPYTNLHSSFNSKVCKQHVFYVRAFVVMEGRGISNSAPRPSIPHTYWNWGEPWFPCCPSFPRNQGSVGRILWRVWPRKGRKSRCHTLLFPHPLLFPLLWRREIRRRFFSVDVQYKHSCFALVSVASGCFDHEQSFSMFSSSYAEYYIQQNIRPAKRQKVRIL